MTQIKLSTIEQRMIQHFVERVKKSKKETHINNSDLYAGSPMYYYCGKCGAFITSLPEGHFCSAPNTCDECKRLEEHELLPEAYKAIQKKK